MRLPYSFDWLIVTKAPLDESGAPTGVPYWVSLLVGVEFTITLALTAWIIALVLGTIVGTLRTVPNKMLARFGNAYVELFRNIPLLVQLFLWFYVFPSIFPDSIKNMMQQFTLINLLPEGMKIWVSSFTICDWLPNGWVSEEIKKELRRPTLLDNQGLPWAIVGLALFTSARIAEQLRAGIQSLPKGQLMAGQALGLTLPQTYRFVLLPMAFRIVIPPLTSEFMNIFKNSSVAMAITVAELMTQTENVREQSEKVIEVYATVTLIYMVLAFSANRIMNFIEKRVQIPGYIGGGK